MSVMGVRIGHAPVYARRAPRPPHVRSRHAYRQHEADTPTESGAHTPSTLDASSASVGVCPSVRASAVGARSLRPDARPLPENGLVWLSDHVCIVHSLCTYIHMSFYGQAFR